MSWHDVLLEAHHLRDNSDWQYRMIVKQLNQVCVYGLCHYRTQPDSMACACHQIARATVTNEGEGRGRGGRMAPKTGTAIMHTCCVLLPC